MKDLWWGKGLTILGLVLTYEGVGGSTCEAHFMPVAPPKNMDCPMPGLVGTL
jgi:hypothetical protein